MGEVDAGARDAELGFASSTLVTEVLPGVWLCASMFVPIIGRVAVAPATDSIMRVGTVTTSPLVFTFPLVQEDEVTTAVAAKVTAMDKTTFVTTTVTVTPGPA